MIAARWSRIQSSTHPSAIIPMTASAPASPATTYAVEAAVAILMELGCYGYSTNRNGARIYYVSVARDIKDARTTFLKLTGAQLVAWLDSMAA